MSAPLWSPSVGECCALLVEPAPSSGACTASAAPRPRASGVLDIVVLLRRLSIDAVEEQELEVPAAPLGVHFERTPTPSVGPESRNSQAHRVWSGVNGASVGAGSTLWRKVCHCVEMVVDG